MKPVAGGGVGRFARRPLVIGGVLGVVALVAASCGAPHHLGAKPVDHHALTRVKTTPATATTTSSTTTTTTAPAATTNAGTFTPAAASAPAAVTTTTTDPFPPTCVWSNFVTKVTTDRSSYSPGQQVQISLGFVNTGPACTVNASGFACPRVDIANAAGALVWSSAAPTSVGCPSAFTGPTVLAASWSEGFSFGWGQTSCTPGQAACPGPPVPAGQYQVIGQDRGGSSQIPAGTPVAISLVAANP